MLVSVAAIGIVQVADETVLVRRVVEARQLAASGGVPATGAEGTAALPSFNEKDGSPSSPNEKSKLKQSFWRRLRCW